MSLVLELPDELEIELAKEAGQHALSLPDYVLQLIEQARLPGHEQFKSGADIVAYWKKNGLIGTRPDIADPGQYARDLRQRAETRNHS